MKIQKTETGYEFEADDNAAKELIARGDYKAASKDETGKAAPKPKRKAT